VYNFYQPLNKDIHKRNTILIPTKFVNDTVSMFTDENQNDGELPTPFPVYRPTEDIFLYLVHVAFQVCSVSGHKGVKLSSIYGVLCEWRKEMDTKYMGLGSTLHQIIMINKINRERGCSMNATPA
jgi:hypothetical protein